MLQAGRRPRLSRRLVDRGCWDLRHLGCRPPNKHRGGSISPGIEMRLASMRKGRRVLAPPCGELRSPTLSPPHIGRNHRGSAAARRVGRCGGGNPRPVGVFDPRNPKPWGLVDRRRRSALGTPHILPKFADAHLTLKGYHGLLNTSMPDSSTRMHTRFAELWCSRCAWPCSRED